MRYPGDRARRRHGIPVHRVDAATQGALSAAFRWAWRCCRACRRSRSRRLWDRFGSADLSPWRRLLQFRGVARLRRQVRPRLGAALSGHASGMPPLLPLADATRLIATASEAGRSGIRTRSGHGPDLELGAMIARRVGRRAAIPGADAGAAAGLGPPIPPECGFGRHAARPRPRCRIPAGPGPAPFTQGGDHFRRHRSKTCRTHPICLGSTGTMGCCAEAGTSPKTAIRSRPQSAPRQRDRRLHVFAGDLAAQLTRPGDGLKSSVARIRLPRDHPALVPAVTAGGRSGSPAACVRCSRQAT